MFISRGTHDPRLSSHTPYFHPSPFRKSLDMSYLIPQNPPFRCAIWVGTYEYFFQGPPDQQISGKCWVRTTSDAPVPNGKCPGTVPFGPRNKFTFCVGCPRLFQSPTREAPRPTRRGGLGDGSPSPPREKKVSRRETNVLGCPSCAWIACRET
jgi:hypothetical protein